MRLDPLRMAVAALALGPNIALAPFLSPPPGTVRNLVCGAIVTPMEGAYGNQEGHPGRFAGGT